MQKSIKTTNSWLLVVVIVVVSVTVVVVTAAAAAECIINIDCGQQIKVKEYKCVFLLMTYSTKQYYKNKTASKAGAVTSFFVQIYFHFVVEATLLSNAKIIVRYNSKI